MNSPILTADNFCHHYAASDSQIESNCNSIMFSNVGSTTAYVLIHGTRRILKAGESFGISSPYPYVVIRQMFGIEFEFDDAEGNLVYVDRMVLNENI